MDEGEGIFRGIWSDPKKVQKHLKNCEECRTSLLTSFRTILDRVLHDEEAWLIISKIKQHSGDLD